MVENNKKKEIEVFNKLADEEEYSEAYEEEYCELYNRLFEGEMNNKRLKVLDVGCGPGIHSIRLAKMGFDVVGVDISKSAILKAQQNANAEGLDILFIIEDIENLTFEDDYFDFCFCGAVLHHFQNLNKVARVFYRVTKIGGMVYSYDPNALHIYTFFAHNILNRSLHLHRYYKYFSPNEWALKPSDLKMAFKEAGFTNFKFSSMTLHSKKKKFKHIRNLSYYLCDKIFTGLRGGNMLLMCCRK